MLWDTLESDTTERLHFHFLLSCIGEKNDNLLQCSCLENPREGGAWWAAISGGAQKRTRLKRLSSSSSSVTILDTLSMALSRRAILTILTLIHEHKISFHFLVTSSVSFIKVFSFQCTDLSPP